ncbi:hypothetical protein I4U23_001214 [Adineta vaga]|nr:hypothetical protein I4U23_001214 [Adineta vaga]
MADIADTLLLLSGTIAKPSDLPPIKIFLDLSILLSYLTNSLANADVINLFVSSGVIEKLICDPLYEFSQLRVIYVYCDNSAALKHAQRCTSDKLKKLRFFLKKNLSRKIKNVMDVHITTSTNSSERRETALMDQERISNKRSSAHVSPPQEAKRSSNSLAYDYHVRDTVKNYLRYICSSCKLFLHKPYQLVCGHRICQNCIIIKNNGMNCFQCCEISAIEQIWFDKGFFKEMNELLVTCQICDWSGSLKLYQEHDDREHMYKIPRLDTINVERDSNLLFGRTEIIKPQQHYRHTENVFDNSQNLFDSLNLHFSTAVIIHEDGAIDSGEGQIHHNLQQNLPTDVRDTVSETVIWKISGYQEKFSTYLNHSFHFEDIKRV